MPERKPAPSLDREAISIFFAQQDDVVVAYLFGSLARGEADSASDVDIAVFLEPNLDPEIALERRLELVEKIEQFSDGEIQVTLLNEAAPLLAFQVVRDGVLLFERSKENRIAFQVLTMKHYFDIQPMLAFFNQALIRRIKEEGLGRRKRNSEGTLEAARRVYERLASVSED